MCNNQIIHILLIFWLNCGTVCNYLILMYFTGRLISWTLILHGTKDNPIRMRQPGQGLVVTEPDIPKTQPITGTTQPPVSTSARHRNHVSTHYRNNLTIIILGKWQFHSYSTHFCEIWINISVVIFCRFL
jgi:hypothetical protein